MTIIFIRIGETARILLKKIQDSEKERKAISSIQKLARDRAKKVSLHNRKLRDCRIHYNSNDEQTALTRPSSLPKVTRQAAQSQNRAMWRHRRSSA
ncbi:MAG: hypothetical protein MZV63_52050 [Marinilabiliales bacterium]|nr:hypothetical protein [Marinilabiliales bacterium]